MESALSKKINAFKVSIRKQQIQAYKKQKRRHLFQDQHTDHIQTEDMNASTEEMYCNLLEATTLQNLQSMGSQSLNNNTQMLIEIVGGTSGHLFKDRYQNLVCSLLDFFQYSYSLQYGKAIDELNQNHVIEQQNKMLRQQISQSSIGQGQRAIFEVNLKQNYVQQKERRIKVVAFDRLLSIIQPNNFLKLIALIYFEISPKNLTYTDKTIILVRQILSYLTIDRSVITHYLSQFGIQRSSVNPRHINKSTALLIILNITYNQDEQILKMVYDSNILHSLADWIQSLGCFQMYDKEVVAAIYANCIEYLCQRTKNEKIFPQSSQINDQANQKQNVLLLHLFQGLLATENANMYDKLVFIAVNLLKTSKQLNLPCLNYLIQLSQNFMLSIILTNQYFEHSEELFIILSELYDSSCTSNVLLDFLDIILTKCTVVYYKDRNMQKNRANGENQSNSKLKGLQNITKLIEGCRNLLTNPVITFQTQQKFFRYLAEFWCKEELFGIRIEMFNFVSTAFAVSNQFSELILDQYCDFTAQLANQSCERIDQIGAQLNLLYVFLGRLEHKCSQEQHRLIQQNLHVFEEIKARLEDYLIRFDRIEEAIYKLTEICLERIEKILSNTGML